MPYAFIQDVPVNEKIYGQIRTMIGSDTPKGLVAHLAYKYEGGLRYVDVWDTQDDWHRFRDARVEPAVGEVLAGLGIAQDPTQPKFEGIELVDCWLGDRA
ncbi:MAG: hypothetical protein ABI658_33080 [Acidimicrobiales bacterium]